MAVALGTPPDVRVPPPRVHGRSRRPVHHAPFDAVAAFDEHGSALLGYAVNVLRDRPLAEDCVQEAFLRAWRARDRFDPERGSERTWLFTILRSTVADAARAAGRAPALADGGLPVELEAPGTDPLDRWELVEALAALSEEHRAVVVAIHLEGLTYQEVSARTSVPVGTLRTRAFYALRALRSHFTAGERS